MGVKLSEITDKIPNTHILEVALIGTGGGYGESIVIHLANNEWIIIDSCKDPYTKICLPLDYLEHRGVDIQNCVKLIICSHWHDDHIQGISELLAKSTSAVFCMPMVADLSKFYRFIGLDNSGPELNASGSSTFEMNTCMKIIEERQLSISKLANQDKLLYKSNCNGTNVEVFSLSPSELVIKEFGLELSESLMQEAADKNIKIIANSPNTKSVVILVSVNSHHVLLGADLEATPDNKKGWLCILDTSECIKGKKCSLFKIPHHGSENGYEKRIWNELLENDTIVAELTPFHSGKSLPKKEMLRTYLSHTNKLYITSLSSFTRYKPKKRNKSIEKIINQYNKKLYEDKYKFGLVLSSIDITDPNAEWDIKLYEEATQINEDHCK